MATSRTATSHWDGTLTEGAGQVTMQSSGIGTFNVTWASRAEEPDGRTSPEQLIAAAHSSCFSMALSGGLARAGKPATSLDTTADVTFQPGTGITGIVIKVTGVVPGMSAEEFQEAAEGARTGCPVSQALQAVPISLRRPLPGSRPTSSVGRAAPRPRARLRCCAVDDQRVQARGARSARREGGCGDDAARRCHGHRVCRRLDRRRATSDATGTKVPFRPAVRAADCRPRCGSTTCATRTRRC